MQSTHLVLVIPCFNCGPAVREVIKKSREFTDDILTVNDGSTDETPQLLQECQTQSIGWKTNRGKGYALIEGFKYFLNQNDWDVLITVDSDGQHAPEDIPKLVSVYEAKKPGMVLGVRRFDRRKTPVHRYWANTISSKIITWLTGCKVTDFQCGYRLFSREALENLVPKLTSQAYSIETEMVLLAHREKIPMQEVEIAAIYNDEANRRSTWKPIKDSIHIAHVVWKYL